MLGDQIDIDRDIVRDVDGNVYKTVRLGYQTWMAENMRVRHYTNDDGTKGDAIPHDGSSDGSDGWESDKNCYSFLAKYGTTTEGDENDPEFKGFGLLYQWNAAMNGEASTNDSNNPAQGICPTGWHIPTNADFDNLQKILGDSGGTENDTWNNGKAENIGTALKYGKFNAMPLAGNRNTTGAKWSGRGTVVYFWRSVEKDDYTWRRDLKVTEAGMNRSAYYKDYGFTVRCIKD
jgi:uncharacterized protein (TIGR02145 family)